MSEEQCSLARHGPERVQPAVDRDDRGAHGLVRLHAVEEQRGARVGEVLDAQDERRDQGGDEDDDAIEMNEDVGGALEDVPDKGDDEAESGDEEEQDLDEKIEDLDKSDPAAVDEKLWGDEKGPEDEGGQDDKIGNDRSKEQQQDESEVVAKEGGEKKEQKGEKGKEGRRADSRSRAFVFGGVRRAGEG